MAERVTPHGLVGSGNRFVSDPAGLAQSSLYRQGLAAQRVAGPARSFTDTRGGAVAMTIDLPLDRIANALRMFADNIDRDPALAEALNHTSDKFHTRLKKLLQLWTGINTQAALLKAMHKRRAYPGNLVAGVIVRDRHRVISRKNFDARWQGKYSPVTHNAWGKQRAAFGAFLLPGKEPAFRRVGTARNAIKPLYGPNAAREMQRNEDLVRAELRALVQVDLVPRIVRNMTYAADKAKASAGV